MTASDTLRQIEHKIRHSLALSCPKCGGEMANDGYPDKSQIEEMPDEYDYYHAPSYWRCDHCIERRCSDCSELECECSRYELPSPNLEPDENGMICCPSCGRGVPESEWALEVADICGACERGDS